MASANLDLVRSIYAAWERGDFSSAEWAHPEIAFVMTGGAPADGTWKGLAGMAAGFGEFLRQWADLRITAEKYRELDDQRVLVLDHPRGHGKTSGIEIGHAGATLFHLRDRKVARLVSWWDRDRALADLGLEE
jgi:ketosteroid isomerase-like protein